MDSHELAWKVIDYWIKKDYTSKADAIDELGSLDDLALRMMEVIETQDLNESDGMTFVSLQIEQALF